jgi:inorganic pyrophosphatase
MENNIFVHIEIPKNTNIKYEYDHHTNRLICDRILHTPFSYPFNYGYIPDTLSNDGDPLDAIVIMEEVLVAGSFINCKVIGVLQTIDEAGEDDKLILVPINKVDPNSININDINDLNDIIKNKIKFFYENYKNLEPNKWIKVDEFQNKDVAIKILNKCYFQFNNKLSIIN